MNTEALLRLADKLQGKGPYEKVGPVPRKKFDIRTWIEGDLDSKKRLTETQCGTAACACGWAALDPWFNERGLVMLNGQIGVFDKIEGAYLTGFYAAQNFFKIDWDQSQWLFHGKTYVDYADRYTSDTYVRVTPRQVAKRIREFVEKQEAKAAA